MADDELSIEEGKGGKGKLIIIIVAVVVLLGGGAGAWFLLGSSDPEPVVAEGQEGEQAGADGESEETEEEGGGAQMGTALYVSIPNGLTFNIPGAQGRIRTVDIRVQLMVRGLENEELVKTNIPLIKGTLLSAFSSSNADDLVTEAGKAALRDQALREVRSAMRELAGKDVVERVLFTGFVMQ